ALRGEAEARHHPGRDALIVGVAVHARAVAAAHLLVFDAGEAVAGHVHAGVDRLDLALHAIVPAAVARRRPGLRDAVELVGHALPLRLVAIREDALVRRLRAPDLGAVRVEVAAIDDALAVRVAEPEPALGMTHGPLLHGVRGAARVAFIDRAIVAVV